MTDDESLIRLRGVLFEDDHARATAVNAGLSAEAFQDVSGSGPGGCFTLDDVIEIVRDWA